MTSGALILGLVLGAAALFIVLIIIGVLIVAPAARRKGQKEMHSYLSSRFPSIKEAGCSSCGRAKAAQAAASHGTKTATAAPAPAAPPKPQSTRGSMSPSRSS